MREKSAGTIDGVTRAELPAGIISRGKIEDYDELLKRVKSLLDDLFGARRGKIDVGMAMTETMVYSKIFRMPQGLGYDHYAKALEIEAIEEFPYDLTSQVISNFVLVRSGEKEREFLYATVDADKAKEYERLLNEAGANPVFFEPESSALARAAVSPELSSDALLADIGARTTMLVALGVKGEPVLSSAVPVGGDILTTEIEKRLNVTLAEAEAVKRRSGFDASVDDGRVMLILQNPFDEIAKEIKITINYYHEKTGRDINKIVLAGGTSLLPKVMDYMSSRFADVEVSRADPLKRFAVKPNIKLPPKFKQEAVLYSTAVGLAVRAAGSRDRPGPNLLPSARGHGRKSGGFINFIRSLFKKPLRPMSPTKKSPRKKASPKKSIKKKTATKKKSSKPSSSKKAAIDFDAKKEEIKEEEEVVETTATQEPEEAKGDAASGLNAIVEAEDSVDADEGIVPERDFGMGVGDILSGSSEKKDADEQLESDEAVDKVSIESILQGRSSGGADGVYEDDEYGTVEEDPHPKKRKIRWSVAIPLVVFVLAILLVAEGAGLFGRGGSSKLFSAITPFFGGDGGKEQTTEPAETGPVVPSLISMNVLISSVEDEEEVAVSVVPSRIIETDVTATDSFQATGEAPAEEARAVGTITVVNETSNDYRFVATTRFLSTDGILFRLKEESDIPANSTADVEVYADEVGASGDIGPSRFTIPGLGGDLEQYVYGRSRTAMTGGSGTVAAVKEDDIETARATLLDRLFDEARENFRSMISAGEIVLDDLITSNELDSTLPDIGQEGTAFDVALTVQFSTLVVPEADLLAKLGEKLLEELPENVVPTDYELGAMLYTVEAFDTTSGRAEIRAEAPVQRIQ